MKLNNLINNKKNKNDGIMENNFSQKIWEFLWNFFIPFCLVAVFSFVLLWPMVQKSLGYKTDQEKLDEQIITEYKKTPHSRIIWKVIDEMNPKDIIKYTSESFQDEIGLKLEKINNLRIFLIVSAFSFVFFYIFKFFKKKYHLKSNSEIVWRLSGYDIIEKLYFISFILILILQMFIYIRPLIYIGIYLLIISLFCLNKSDSSFKSIAKTLLFSFDSLLFLPLYAICIFSVSHLEDYSRGKDIDKANRIYNEERFIEATKAVTNRKTKIGE